MNDITTRSDIQCRYSSFDIWMFSFHKACDSVSELVKLQSRKNISHTGHPIDLRSFDKDQKSTPFGITL